ncbi:hypothetical protein B0H13DRAFT_2325555 [Mycena leptocephala]|nr:hypothetical protein B0H13DRAFT_2325555 [Mycena leptocephala]
MNDSLAPKFILHLLGGEFASAIRAMETRAVALLGDRRSTFGSGGIRVVDDIFEASKYYGGLDGDQPERRLVEVVQADARYALRFNGPALFKVPTPESCTSQSNLKPTGFLESRAFIDTVKPFIKNSNFQIIRMPDGKIDLSVLPVGAFAMGAVARAYKLPLTEDRATTTIPDFSATVNYGWRCSLNLAQRP